MRLRLGPAEADEEELDITPLIDCVFLLVLFFMLTSSFIDEAKVFKIVLPKADQPQTIARDQADSISVSVEGKLLFRDPAGEAELADLGELVERLKARAGPLRPVILRCDARCEYRQFMEVKNALKLAGVETVFEEVEVADGSSKS